MSMIRLSAIHTGLYAPSSAGQYHNTLYSDSKLRGRLGDFARPDNDALSAAGPRISDELDHYMAGSIAKKAVGLSGADPVVMMVNGFLFDPRVSASDPANESDNPHVRLFHFKDFGEVDEVRHHTTGWPGRLDIPNGSDGAGGLAVGFGWYSNPGFAKSLIAHFKNFYARAYDLGTEMGWPLLTGLTALAKHLPAGRPIDIMCHSMGSTVTIRAIALAAKYNLPVLSRIGRIIILGGSEYSGEAQLMYNRLMTVARNRGWSAKTGPYIYNIVSRENDVLDKLAENFGPKSFFSNTQVVGHNGLNAARHADRWIDLRIDGSDMRKWAKSVHGLKISGDNPESVWDHWYYYTHRGNMEMYRRILRDRKAWSFKNLRAAKVPEGVATGFFGD